MAARTHLAFAFPAAVVRKIVADDASRWAALAAYWGFLSLFPLLLVLVSLLGFALEGNPALRGRVAATLAADIPLVGPHVTGAAPPLNGSVLAVAVGLVLAIWYAGSVVGATQEAMDAMWAVPVHERRSYWKGQLLTVPVIAVLAVGVVAVAALAGPAAAVGTGWATALGLAAAWAVAVGALLVVFRVLPSVRVPWRRHLPGALLGATAFSALHAVAGLYVDRVVRGTALAYGTFAVVIGLIAWIHLQAWILMVCTEVNVVATRRLWTRPPTRAS